MAPPLHISRRLMVSSASYLKILAEFGTLNCYWPLNDYASWTTTAGSISETAGGSAATYDKADPANYNNHPLSGSTASNGLHGSCAVCGQPPGGFVAGQLGTFLPASPSTTGVVVAVWARLLRRDAYPSSGVWEPFNISSTSCRVYQSYASSAFSDWGMTIADSGGSIVSVAGFNEADQQQPHLYVWQTVNVGGGNYTHRAFIAHPSGTYQIVATTTTLAGALINVGSEYWTLAGEIASDAAATWLFSAASISTGGADIITTADVSRLYNAGKL